MKLTQLLWLCQTLPEALAVTSLAVVLCKRRLEVKLILQIGVLFAATVYLVRLLPLDFGVHFILLMVILALLLTIQLKIHFSRCLLITLVIGIILAVSETVFIYLFLLLTDTNMDQITLGETIHILIAWPHIIFLLLMALAINQWRKVHPVREGENYD